MLHTKEYQNVMCVDRTKYVLQLLNVQMLK